MFEVDIKKVIRFENDLKRFAKQALPYATRETVNKAAFETRAAYRANMRKGLILRNSWSEGSVRVEKARTLNVSRQAASVGSVAPYMADQEFGAVSSGKGKYKPIATSYAAGQVGRPRTRLPRAVNKLRNIRFNNRKSPSVALVKDAAKKRQKFVFLNLGRRKGVFRVVGTKRKPKIRMVWDMSRRRVRVPRSPLLMPATLSTKKNMLKYYEDALAWQVGKAGLFKY